MLKRLLKDAAHTDPEPGYIGPFPTQAIVDAWLADDRNKVSNEETRKAAVEAKRLREEKTRLAEKGIDIDALEFKL
jgi:phage terminase Nu1 subunit (DNA packaging protein)